MATNEETLAYLIKRWLLLYWPFLPSQVIAEAFPVILGAYITVLSLLRNLAENDSEDELSNATLFEQPGFEGQFYNNYTVTEEFGDNYTISVSNAVLWVCRKGSPDGDFYRTLYRMAIGFLITFHMLTSFSQFFTVKFRYTYTTSAENNRIITITRNRKDGGIIFITFVGAILFNLSFLLLLLSFDISPWSCLSQPSTVYVEYISFSNRYDIQIQHTPNAVTFQKVASVLSLVLAVCWMVARIVFFSRDLAATNVEMRIYKSGDATDIGPADQDNELLEVNIEENN